MTDAEEAAEEPKMIVDTHVHVVSDDRKRYPQVADGAHGASAPSVADIGQPEWPPLTIESLIAMMDGCGIDRALLVQTYFTYHFDNRYMIDCAHAHPGRFESVCVIDQLAPGAADLLSELVTQQNVRGLRMMGARGDHALRDQRSFPLWERAAELGIPICIGAKLNELADARVPIERFTGTKVALEHVWGTDIGDAPYERLQPLFDLAQYPHVYLKTAPNNSHAARKGNGTPRQFFGELIERFSAKRIMWGSNYPAHWNNYGDLKERLAIMEEDFAFLGAEERRWIFGETALSLWPTLRAGAR
jgi:predicted TIM-barrel fold metal-dependent hydrolase